MLVDLTKAKEGDKVKTMGGDELIISWVHQSFIGCALHFYGYAQECWYSDDGKSWGNSDHIPQNRADDIVSIEHV